MENIGPCPTCNLPLEATDCVDQYVWEAVCENDHQHIATQIPGEDWRIVG